MNYLEKYQEEFDYCEMPSKSECVSDNCPGDYLVGPTRCEGTTVFGALNNVLGCRGTTCEECWNEEVPE